MQKFTFSEKKTLLIPNTNTFRPPLDKNGRPIPPDDLLRTFGKIVTAYEKKTGKPVPIPDQKFVGWIKQFCNQLDSGKTSEEIFKSSLVNIL